jgi:hypothetical protein
MPKSSQNTGSRSTESTGRKSLHEAHSQQMESDLAIARDRIRLLEAELRNSKRQELNAEHVRRAIVGLTEATINAEPPRWLFTERNAGTLGVPTLLASDWHWGEIVDGAQIGGVNEYSLEIAQRRARVMIERACHLCFTHIAEPKYPGIVFALGGDMVSGDIHDELTATNEREIMPTVVDLFGTLVWCIDTLKARFGKVFVPCVTGNHGRDTKKIRAKGRNFTSFDWILYVFLSKHFEQDAAVSFQIPDGSDALYRVYNHRYLLTHGDQFRGGDGLIGPLGPITRGDHKKRSRNSQIELDYQTMLMGHFHQLMQLPRLIVNGSLKGYDEYAYQGNYIFERPQQALWLTHPGRGITFSFPVQVEDPKKADKQPWVSWK